jgi:hypothetical protein
MYKAAYNVEPTKAADKSFDAVYVLAIRIAKTSDKTQVAAYIAANSFTTPNSTIKFTSDHAVENIPVVVNVIKNGVQVPFKQ